MDRTVPTHAIASVHSNVILLMENVPSMLAQPDFMDLHALRVSFVRAIFEFPVKKNIYKGHANFHKDLMISHTWQ